MGKEAQKSERWEKGQTKYCFSVSVLSGLGWTFDVVYRVDQREEINTNISAAWPAEHLSDRLNACSPPFFFLLVCLSDGQNACMFIYLPVCLMASFTCLFDCVRPGYVFTHMSVWLDARITIFLPGYLIAYLLVCLSFISQAVWIASTQIGNYVSLKKITQLCSYPLALSQVLGLFRLVKRVKINVRGNHLMSQIIAYMLQIWWNGPLMHKLSPCQPCFQQQLAAVISNWQKQN